MTITQKKLLGVLAAPAAKRYGHFAKMAADNRCVWGLFENGWTMVAGDDHGREAVAVWPAKEFAELFAERCGGGEPRAIDLEAFFDLLDRLRDSGNLLAVFPTPDGKGVFATPDDVEAHVRYELKLIEG